MNQENSKSSIDSDKPYKIIVDQKELEWIKPYITGLEVKELAGVDTATYDAWQKVPGQEDILLKNEERVDLDKKGVEDFFTLKSASTEG